MKRTPKLFLYDIVDAIEHIERYIDGITKEDFLKNEQRQDAVIRRFQIIGEASGHLPNSLLEKYPEVPWREVKGLRNKVIHEYADIDFELVWKVSIDELSILKGQIQKIMENY